MLLTRQPSDNAALAAALSARGAEIVELPATRIEHLEDRSALAEAIRRLEPNDWLVVTSRAGVDAVLGALSPAEIRSRIAAVGAATARRWAAAGLESWTPSSPTGAALGRELPLSGRVLLARADRAERGLVRELHARGAELDEVVAYRSVPAVDAAAAVISRRVDPGNLDAVVVYSPGAVDAIVDVLPPAALLRATLVAVGPTTAQRVHERTGRQPQLSDSPSLEDVLSAVTRALDDRLDAPRA